MPSRSSGSTATCRSRRTPTPATPAPTWSPPSTSRWRRGSGRWCRPASRSRCPTGYVALVHPRSGLAARHGLSIVNTPGHRRRGLPRRDQGAAGQPRPARAGLAAPRRPDRPAGGPAVRAGRASSRSTSSGLGARRRGLRFYRWLRSPESDAARVTGPRRSPREVPAQDRRVRRGSADRRRPSPTPGRGRRPTSRSAGAHRRAPTTSPRWTSRTSTSGSTSASLLITPPRAASCGCRSTRPPRRCRP